MNRKPKGYYTDKSGKVRPVFGKYPHINPLGRGTKSLRIPKRSLKKKSRKVIVPLKDLDVRREIHWKQMKALDSQYLDGKITQQQYDTRRTALVNVYESKKPDLRPHIYKTMIGHYGGLYVHVPEEHFTEFKSHFPSREFPRRVETTDVREKYTFEGERNFRKRFHSSNKIKEVYFGDRSKGLQRIDRHLRMPRSE